MTFIPSQLDPDLIGWYYTVLSEPCWCADNKVSNEVKLLCEDLFTLWKVNAPHSATMLSPTTSLAIARCLASLAACICKPFSHLKWLLKLLFLSCVVITLRFFSFCTRVWLNLPSGTMHSQEEFQ